MTKKTDKSQWIDTGGDEISRVGIWAPPGALHGEGPPSYEDDEAAGDGGFWREMSSLAYWCDAALAAVGYPNAAAKIRSNTLGQWCYVADEEMPLGQHAHTMAEVWEGLGGTYAGIHSEPFSRAWYAGDLGLKIWQVEQERGAISDLALDLVLQIGIAIKDFEWRTKFKPEIVGFRQVRTTRRKGSSLGAAVLADRAQEARVKIAQLAFASGGLVRWAGKSSKAQARDLRTMASEFDKERSDEEKLFRSPKGGILSTRWFEDRISEWQSEDLISKALQRILEQ